MMLYRIYIVLFIVCSVVIATVQHSSAEPLIYTETVTVAMESDEYVALHKAKKKAREQALRNYLNNATNKDLSTTLNFADFDTYTQDMGVLESKTQGIISRELVATIKVAINEDEVRSHLKHQGTIEEKKDKHRIFVILIPGKMDSGDAPAILDNIRAEVRKKLTAAEYTVVDSEDQIKRLEALTEEADYNKLAGQLEGLGEWVVIGKIDVDITEDGSIRAYHVLMTGKAVNIAGRDLMWEGNIDGLARVRTGESPLAALRMAAIDGGKSFAKSVLSALNTKVHNQEIYGSRFEVSFSTRGDYKLERKIIQLLTDDIKGLKDVSQKNRGKNDMIVDLYYSGKISDLVNLLLDNFEKDSQLKRLNPQINGNNVKFK